MSVSFEIFYQNANYRKHKRLLFNYLLRKAVISGELTTAGGRILDVGSGIAPMTPVLQSALLGDTSPTGMKIMREEGYRCAVLDLTHLGLQSGSFDTVVCSEVIEHIEADGAAIEEIARGLRPGGTLLLTVPLHRYYWSVDDNEVGHQRRYNPATLRRRLEAAGLRVEKAASIGSPFERIATIAALLAFRRMQQSNSSIDRQPGRVFTLANRTAAALLRAAAVVTPLKLSSIGMFVCRKGGGDRLTG